jgi:hypothetical protein
MRELAMGAHARIERAKGESSRRVRRMSEDAIRVEEAERRKSIHEAQ